MGPIRFPLAALTLLCATQAEAKTLVYCFESDPATLSPVLSVSGADMVASAYQMFDSLTAMNPAMTEIEPALAEAWEVADDGRAYTFHLRRGVKFHENHGFTPTRDLDADDVLFTFERQWKPDHPFHRVSGGTYTFFDVYGLGRLLERIEKLDDHTVRFRLTEPDTVFPLYMSAPTSAIYSAEYAQRLEAAGTPEKLDSEPIGAGPFKLLEHRKDALVRYAAHPDYWGGKPALDQVVLAVTPDARVRYQKLKAGECHVMAYPSPADVMLLRADPNIELLETVGLDFGFLALNTEHEPLADRRVRQAINLAIDQRAIMDAVFLGIGGVPAVNPIPPSLWSYDAGLRGYPYDPQAARGLLAEAGHGTGLALTLWAVPIQRPYNPNSRRTAELIQADLAKVGIRTEIVSYENAEYISRGRRGEHDMLLIGWLGDFADPDNFLRPMWSCGAVAHGLNFSRICDERFDELLHKARSTQDREQRTTYYREAQAIWHDEAFAVPIAHSVQFWPVRKEVRGFQASPGGIVRFQDVDLAE